MNSHVGQPCEVRPLFRWPRARRPPGRPAGQAHLSASAARGGALLASNHRLTVSLGGGRRAQFQWPAGLAASGGKVIEIPASGAAHESRIDRVRPSRARRVPAPLAGRPSAGLSSFAAGQPSAPSSRLGPEPERMIPARSAREWPREVTWPGPFIDLDSAPVWADAEAPPSRLAARRIHFGRAAAPCACPPSKTTN